jgi:hypothetical protein
MPIGWPVVAKIAVPAAASLFGAKMSSGASGRAAQLTTDAATRAAELDRQTAAEQLAYARNQARMDREPDALRLTAPVLPPYVEDPTQYTVNDDTGVDR